MYLRMEYAKVLSFMSEQSALNSEVMPYENQ